MMFLHKEIIFEIPPLTSEFIFLAQLYLDEVNDILFVSEENNNLKGNPISRFSILHSIIGDINKFHITCREYKSCNHNCKLNLEPIFKKYCNDNFIEYKFYCLNYE